MRVHAFQGLRYARTATEIEELAAPPYDQIDDETRDQMHQRSPEQFTWLTRPSVPPGSDESTLDRAAELHRKWVAEGTVYREADPRLYAYTIQLEGGAGRRLGLCALVGVEAPESGVIRAHEATLAKPLAERLDLLRAMRVDLEPVLLLADDGGELDRLLERDEAASEVLARYTDDLGNLHTIAPIASDRIDEYRRLLAPLPAAIADGHHRYKTARVYAGEIGAQPGSAAAAKLAIISSLSSPALTIDPIHRGLQQPVDLGAAGAAVVVSERRAASLRSAGDTGGQELAAAVAAAQEEAESPVLGVWSSSSEAEIWFLDPAAAPPTTPHGARQLSVSLLHDGILAHLGFAPESATDGTVSYRSDPARLGAQLAENSLAVGFFLPPMEPGAFAAAIADGDLLPPKSTRFLPKVMSGLVWADHDSRLG